MKHCLSIVVLVAACTDFTDVPRDVCGNGLLEPGEDCDSEDASCVRCAVTCSTPQDCPTSDYTCGVDGFCHAPGGLLAEPAGSVTFPADDLEITDVDRDGIGDVIGVSKTSIVVRHGDANGSLLTADSFVTPSQSGPHAFGDLDGDGRTDVTLSTLDGIVTYTSRFGSLAPVAIESPLVDANGPVNIRQLFAVGQFQLGAFLADNDSNGMLLVVIDLTVADGFHVDVPCVGRLGVIDQSRLDLTTVDIYRSSPDAAVNVDFVVSFLTDTGQLCATSITGNPIAGYTFVDVTPAGVGLLAQPPVLADLDVDGDVCPSMINSSGGAAALRVWNGRTIAGRCSFDPAGVGGALMPAVADAPANATAVGRIPIQPQFLGVSPDALVLTSGVYAFVPGANAFGQLFDSSQRELKHVAFADIDKDGDTDAVLATADEDDLDILFRFPGGLQLLRIDTASQVTSLTLGDYDGNSFLDIAYTETNTDHQAMMISYGTSDRPLEPVQVAAFSGVSSVTLLEFPDNNDPLNLADDLAVIFLEGDVPTLSLLHGSAQRTMLSFFEPRAEANAQRDELILRGAVIGDFTDSTATHRDLVAFGTPRQGFSIPMRAWRVAGTDKGLDGTPNLGQVANGVADCDNTGVCVANAKYLAWPTTPGHDLIIAVDRESTPHAAVLDPRANVAAFGKTDIATALFDDVPGNAPIASMYAVDVDGDSTRELLASFGGDREGAVLHCTMSSAGVPTACADLTTTVKARDAEVTACTDAAPGRVAQRGPTTPPSPGTDLVVLCHTEQTSALYRVSNATGSLAAERIAIANGVRALRVADVTGDGVDDVIAVQGSGGQQAVVVFAQCSSRELEGCRVAAAGESP